MKYSRIWDENPPQSKKEIFFSYNLQNDRTLYGLIQNIKTAYVLKLEAFPY